jgi:hypothetical protein
MLWNDMSGTRKIQFMALCELGIIVDQHGWKSEMKVSHVELHYLQNRSWDIQRNQLMDLRKPCFLMGIYGWKNELSDGF